MATPKASEPSLEADVRQLRERIAELERDQRALRADKDRLSTVIASMNDEVWFADSNNRLALVNPAVVKEFRLDSGEPLLVEKVAASFEVFRPDGSPRPVEEAPPLRALKGEVLWRQEEIVRTPGTGQLRHREVNAAPVRDASGKIAGSVCVVRDITERKRVEDALRESEARLRFVLRRCNIGVWELDTATQTTFHSREHDRIYGYDNPPPQWTYDLFLEQVVPEDRERVAAVQQQAFKTLSDWTCEYRIRRPDGQIRWIRTNGAHMRESDGVSRRIAGIVQDITERKQTEEALRESERRERARAAELDALMDAAPVAVWIAHDPECRRITGNAYADRVIMGIERGGNISRSAPPGNAAVTYKMYRRGIELRPEEMPVQVTAATGKPAELEEYDLIFEDGRRVHLLLGVVPLFDAGVRVRGCVAAGIDITDRKRAEEALRVSEKENRNLIEHAPTAIYEIDFDGPRFTMGNEVMCKLSGYSQEELLRLNPFDLMDEESRKRFADRVKRAAASEELSEEVEYKGWRKNGVPFWAVLHTTFRREGGRIVGALVVAHDVTERKRMEDALRESEELLRAVTDNSPDAIYVKDRLSRWVMANPAVLRIVGTTAGQALGKTDLELYDDPAVGNGILENDRRIIESGQTEAFEEVADTPDGRRTFLSVKAPRRDAQGNIVGLIGISRDITERKQAEAEIKESRDKYQALIETTTDFIWETDAEGRYTYCSPQMMTLWGLNPKDMIGKTFFDAMPAEHREGGAELFLAIAKSARPFRGLESVAYDARGRLIHVEVNGAPFFADDGALLGFRGVTRDITERRNSEERLRQSQKLESLGILAGGVAHDFNNLLVGVIGNASLVQEMLPPDHEAADLVQGIVKTGEQAAHLTRQMLAYSGKGRFVVEALDLSALIRDISDLARPSIPKRVQLLLDLGDDLPPVEADRGQVQQVLMNLVINASEAIGSHDGIVTVRTGAQVVNADYLRRHPEAAGLNPGEYVALEVRDNGCGMDEAVKARIFDPFFSTKFTGRGLGLAAVAGIVRGHRGAIILSSQPGRGSSFTVLFPPAARPIETRQAAPGVVKQGSGLVLVVDDERVVREMAKRALERQGYTVLVAYDGMAAVDIFKRHPGNIELAILDLSMPGMSGEETLHELRKIRPEAKVLVSSGYSESEAMTMFHGQRVTGFIQKPYTVAEIAEKVKLALN